MELDSSSSITPSRPTYKRKHQDTLHVQVDSPPLQSLPLPQAAGTLSSVKIEPSLRDVSTPPSSPAPSHQSNLHDAPDFHSTSARHDNSIGGQKALLSRTAPHLLDHRPSPSVSRTPSLPPSGRSSPTSEDDHSASGHHGRQSSSAPSSSSKRVSTVHKTPEGYRGPVPFQHDSEDIVRRPQLVVAPGSAGALFNTINFPVNRNQWRYTGTGPATQHLPNTVYKTLQVSPDCIHWCWSDRSVFSKLSKEASVFSTDKGFRSGRTNVGVRQGEWYAEIEILAPEQVVPSVGAAHVGPPPAPMRDGPHVRVGWGRREAPLNAPAGFDGYSYAYRDRTGDRVTLSRPQSYGRPYTMGDVVGLYIKLPPEREAEDEWDPAKIRRERLPIRYKGQLYFEALEYGRSREMEHLKDLSRKGLGLEEAVASINSASTGEGGTTDASGSGGTALGSSGGASNGGSAKVKNKSRSKALSGVKDKQTGPRKPQYRPLPRLKSSVIGFFVNGEPQGTAFTDLFDYRPLRVKAADPGRSTPGGASGSGGGSGGPSKDRRKSADVAPVVRSRENIFDDGALGYFPFVSCYGNARARLITGDEGFRFPPPVDIKTSLLQVDRTKNAVAQDGPNYDDDDDVKMQIDDIPQHSPSTIQRWKPLCERYAEHVEEQWRHDVADEERAAKIAQEEAEKTEKKEQQKAAVAAARREREREKNAKFKIERSDTGGAGGSETASPVPTSKSTPTTTSTSNIQTMQEDGTNFLSSSHLTTQDDETVTSIPSHQHRNGERSREAETHQQQEGTEKSKFHQEETRIHLEMMFRAARNQELEEEDDDHVMDVDTHANAEGEEEVVDVVVGMSAS